MLLNSAVKSIGIGLRARDDAAV